MEWISVDDNLPFRCSVYLIGTSDNGVWIGFWISNKWLDEDGNPIECDKLSVTHWMPLPKPPSNNAT